MNRHFLVPVTIAAALHGVLFGIPGGPKPGLVEPTVGIALDERPMIPVVPLPPEDPAEKTDNDLPPIAVVLPGGPDVSIPDPHAIFKIPPTVVSERTNLGPITTIPPGAFTTGGVANARDGIVDPKLLDRIPNARVRIAPTYPHEARSSGRNGEVVVEFVVDESGRVCEARVVNSTDRVFEASALAAIMRWRFEPGKRLGVPVKFRMALPIMFRLDGAE